MKYTLDDAIKYVSWDRGDWFPALVGSAGDHHKPLVFADWLEEHGADPELADRIRKHVQKVMAGGGGDRPDTGDGRASADVVRDKVRSRHPSPVVRAMVGGHRDPKTGQIAPDHPDLTRLLLSSPHDADHDIAVYLAKPDPEKSQPHLRTLRRDEFKDAGLTAKQVNGVLYLLDHERGRSAGDTNGSYDAPEILYHADVNDAPDVAGLIEHAKTVAASRRELGPARMGNVAFTSHA